MVYSHIWLNPLVDDHQFGYVTKNLKTLSHNYSYNLFICIPLDLGSFNTNYITCRNAGILKSNFSKEKKIVKENKEYFEIFRNISFQYGIFLINQLFDTHVLKLPMNCTMVLH